MIESIKLPETDKSYRQREVDGVTIHEWRISPMVGLMAHRTGSAPWVMCSLQRGDVRTQVSDRWLIESLLNLDESRWYTISAQVWGWLEGRE